MSDYKDKVILFIRQKVSKGQNPSVEDIVDRFEGGRKRFYKEFRNIGEAYELAGHSVPADRLKAVKTMESNRSRERSPNATENFSLRLVASRVGAEIQGYELSFLQQTESVKEQPFWVAHRKRIQDLCSHLRKLVDGAQTKEDVEECRKGFSDLNADFDTIFRVKSLSAQVSELEAKYAKLSPVVEAAEKLEKEIGLPHASVIEVVQHASNLLGWGVKTQEFGTLAATLREAKTRNVTASEFITYVREHPRAEEEVKLLNTRKPILQLELDALDELKKRCWAMVKDFEIHIKGLEIHIKNLEARRVKLVDVIKRFGLAGMWLGDGYESGIDLFHRMIKDYLKLILKGFAGNRNIPMEYYKRIIIPFFGGEHSIESNINSLAKQAKNASWKIAFIDDRRNMIREEDLQETKNDELELLSRTSSLMESKKKMLFPESLPGQNHAPSIPELQYPPPLTESGNVTGGRSNFGFELFQDTVLLLEQSTKIVSDNEKLEFDKDWWLAKSKKRIPLDELRKLYPGM